MGSIDYKRMSTPELERLWSDMREDLYRIRQEIDRRRGHSPVREGAQNIDFTQYLTD